MRRVLRCTALAVVLLVGFVQAPTAAAEPRPPERMAAIGDSITRAADVCCWYGDHPANSWSTGGAFWDGVRSHFERLRALDPDIGGRNDNLAVSGARMSDGPRQAQAAVDLSVHYVTIELGANDVCTSSPGTMTSADTFRSHFERTMNVLDDGLPARARVLVASIPDVSRLWALYKDDPVAQLVWGLADICQSMLAPERTDADRDVVRQRNQQFNAVLAEVCAQHSFCRYDGGAVFAYSFTKQDVSKLDYFHPSLSGQAQLAEATWRAGFWAS